MLATIATVTVGVATTKTVPAVLMRTKTAMVMKKTTVATAMVKTQKAIKYKW